MDLYRDAQLFPASLRGQAEVVRTSELSLTKSARRWRTARGRLVRPHRGYYLTATPPVDFLDRCRAALVVAPGAVVGFHTAAALHGFGVVDSDSIHIVVPIGGPFPQRPGIVVHQSGLAVAPTALVADIPCTAPARTAVDLARALPRPRALAVLDACLFCSACGLAELTAEVALHRGRRGYRQALALVPRADGRSQCAQESHLRLVVHDAGLTMFEPQVQVPDRYGEPLFVIDLADRRLRVAAEYDGSSHLHRRRLRDDRRRHNYLSSRHWRMRYFTDEELYRRPDAIPATLRAALVDARSDPRLPRLP